MVLLSLFGCFQQASEPPAIESSARKVSEVPRPAPAAEAVEPAPAPAPKAEPAQEADSASWDGEPPLQRFVLLAEAGRLEEAQAALKDALIRLPGRFGGTFSVNYAKHTVTVATERGGFIKGSLTDPARELLLEHLAVEVGQPIWVLPEKGEVREGKVVGVEVALMKPACEETLVLMLDTDLATERADRPVVWTLTPPPESWKAPAPTFDREAAIAAARPALPEPYAKQAELFVVAAPGGGARVRAMLAATEDQDFVAVSYLDVIVNAGSATVGEVRQLPQAEVTPMAYAIPKFARDVDGDGELDLGVEGPCGEEWVELATGARTAEAMGGCCC